MRTWSPLFQMGAVTDPQNQNSYPLGWAPQSVVAYTIKSPSFLPFHCVFVNRNIPQPLILKQPRFKMAAAWWHVYRDNPLAQVGERADGHQQQGEHERGDDQGEQFVEVDHGRVL